MMEPDGSMRVICSVVWNGHSQWSFINKDDIALQIYEHTGDAEPKRLMAWRLSETSNFPEFLAFILQKFHLSQASTVGQVQRAIILVQNEFAKVNA